MINPMYPNHNKIETKEYDYQKDFYPDFGEIKPDKSERQNPKGQPVCITVYKNADHTHGNFTRRSVCDIILFINNTSVCQISKKLWRHQHMAQNWHVKSKQMN